MYPQECTVKLTDHSRALKTLDSYPYGHEVAGFCIRPGYGIRGIMRFVSGHDLSRAVTCGRYDRRHSLLKNSSFDFVLKGRGFQPRRKCHKINSALAAEAAPQTAMPLFQQTV